eukprot:GEZU01040965.1.p1 GENE.GEZU01040965.1~~GEZU01040965.1.p1  ORF type:complete len:120 (-),score=5.56 GEZU01040965.1:142-501(-)
MTGAYSPSSGRSSSSLLLLLWANLSCNLASMNRFTLPLLVRSSFAPPPPPPPPWYASCDFSCWMNLGTGLLNESDLLYFLPVPLRSAIIIIIMITIASLQMKCGGIIGCTIEMQCVFGE